MLFCEIKIVNFLIASINLDLGNLKEAEEYYWQLLDRNPENVGYYQQLEKAIQPSEYKFPEIKSQFFTKLFLVLQAIGKVFRNVGLHETLFENKLCM